MGGEMDMVAASCLAEADAGLTEFLQPTVPGFYGRFKERWQDFHVHEIDTTGCELHLSELITPGAVSAELRLAATSRREARQALGPGFSFEPAVEADLQSKLGGGATAQLLAFLRSQRGATIVEAVGAGASEPPTAGEASQCDGSTPSSSSSSVSQKEEPALEPPAFVDIEADRLGDGSKEARKDAHRVIKEAFEVLLNTETVETNGVRQLRVWMRDAEIRVKSSPGVAQANGSDKGDGKNRGKGKGKKGKDKGKGKGRGKRGTAILPDAADAGIGASAGGEYGTLRREGWPKDRPQYLYFRLYKENCNTGEAVSSIASCVGRSVKQFTFAGTKDKRASTVQLVCARRLPADQLRRTVTHRSWDRRIRISDLEYRPERLRLGDLRGNRFNIVLRGVSPNDGAAVGFAFDAVSKQGFLNYFGMQRFGTRAVRTHEVGAAILVGHMDRAARLILGDVAASTVSSGKRSRGDLVGGNDADEAQAPPLKLRKVEPHESGREEDRAGCQSDSAEPKWRRIQDAAALFLQSGDATAALQAMPKNQHLERCVLGAIARGLCGEDVLRQLPHQSLSLYAHAAQSLIWNAVLSRRVRDLGSVPVVGDLVLVSKDDALGGSDSLLLGEGDELMGGDDGDAASSGEEDEVACGQLPEVRELETDADVAACAGLSEVVLPLPGYGVRYPPRLKVFYEELAQELLGMRLEDFHNSNLVPLRGAYRAAVVKPVDCSWRLVPASEAMHSSAKGAAPLQPTDVAKLLEARGDVPSCPKVDDGNLTQIEVAAVETAELEPQPDSKPSIAVLFSCVLPPSSYLTMLLREVTKQPTTSPMLQG